MLATALGASGFLTARSSLGADLTLLLSGLVIVLLTVAVILARRRRYGTHHRVQMVAVILNAVLIAAWMIRSLVLYILPGLPGSLSERGHTLAVVHAVTGAAAVTLGLVVLAGTARPWRRRESLEGWKVAMTTSYFLYLAGLALGVALYVVTYG